MTPRRGILTHASARRPELKKKAVMICFKVGCACHASTGAGADNKLQSLTRAGRAQIISARLLGRVVGTPPASRSVSCLISRHLLALLFRPACQENCRSGHTPAQSSSPARACCPLGISVHLGCPRLVPESGLLNDVLRVRNAVRSRRCSTMHIQIGRLRLDCDPISLDDDKLSQKAGTRKASTARWSRSNEMQ